MWYAAHIIVLARFDDGVQDSYPIWENIVLIHAESPEQAWEKAEKKGQESSGDQFYFEERGNERSAHWEFVGIRKILKCLDNFDPRKGAYEEFGTEVTFSSFTLDSEASLKKFVNDESVVVTAQPSLGEDG